MKKNIVEGVEFCISIRLLSLLANAFMIWTLTTLKMLQCIQAYANDIKMKRKTLCELFEYLLRILKRTTWLNDMVYLILFLYPTVRGYIKIETCHCMRPFFVCVQTKNTVWMNFWIISVVRFDICVNMDVNCLASVIS